MFDNRSDIIMNFLDYLIHPVIILIEYISESKKLNKLSNSISNSISKLFPKAKKECIELDYIR